MVNAARDVRCALARPFLFLFPWTGANFEGHVAFGWVIVIALAISLFLILLIIIAARIRRAREGYTVAPGSPTIGEETLERVPPTQLFGELEGHQHAAAGYL
jgi:hypothetical protein